MHHSTTYLCTTRRLRRACTVILCASINYVQYPTSVSSKIPQSPSSPSHSARPSATYIQTISRRHALHSNFFAHLVRSVRVVHTATSIFTRLRRRGSHVYLLYDFSFRYSQPLPRTYLRVVDNSMVSLFKIAPCPPRRITVRSFHHEINNSLVYVYRMFHLVVLWVIPVPLLSMTCV